MGLKALLAEMTPTSFSYAGVSDRLIMKITHKPEEAAISNY